MPTSLPSVFKFFSQGLAHEDALTHSAHQQSSGQVIASLLGELLQYRKEALDSGKKLAEIEETLFAVVAWLDETLARHARWFGDAKPLQESLFDTRNAGCEFYERLDALPDEYLEAREAYYIALCLGFRGNLYRPQDAHEIEHRKTRLARQLRLKRVDVREFAKSYITAQPYDALDDPKGPRIPGQWPERLFRTAAFAAVAVVMGMLMFHYWSMRTEASTFESSDSPDVATLSALVANKGCHDIVVDQDSAGVVHVRGHAPDAAARQLISDAVRRPSGGVSPTVSVEILPPPLCDAVALATAVRQKSPPDQGGFRIRLKQGRTQLVEGEALVLDAQMPDQPACLYVDYFTADGASVVHLHPTRHKMGACAAAGHKIRIGEPQQGRNPWTVSEPYGRELILAIASPRPLFLAGRGEIESAKEYLEALRNALSGHAAQADYSLLTTQP